MTSYNENNEEYPNIISFISRKGYIIEKSSITDKQLSLIKKNLIVKPIIRNDFGGKPEKFTVYLENEKRICIPKFYGLNNIGKPKKIVEPKYKKIKINFNGSLKERQIEPYNVTIKGLREKGGGVLSIPCGWGKTVLGLKLICDLKVKTLVIVHKTFLLNQWKERINQFIPSAKIGLIKQSVVDVKDKDIVIGMLQSISMKEYSKDIFGEFGFVLVDEVHRISSKIFSRALPKTSTKYTLGLSATPYRDDGLSKIFYWYLGDMLYQKVQGGNKSVIVKCYNFKSLHSKFKEVKNTWTKKVITPTMITNITEINTRNKFILDLIILILTKQEYLKDQKLPKRQILVLSDRLNHLDCLKNMLDNKKICSTGFYIGKMKEEQLDESSKKDVIFGTYPMASEGLDIQSLNTLILATPKSKITQSVGRIMRKESSDINPLIIDIIDDLSVFKNQGYKRRSFYKKKKYRSQFFNIEDGLLVGEGIRKRQNKANPSVLPTLEETIINNPSDNKNIEDDQNKYELNNYEIKEDNENGDFIDSDSDSDS